MLSLSALDKCPRGGSYNLKTLDKAKIFFSKKDPRKRAKRIDFNMSSKKQDKKLEVKSLKGLGKLNLGK